MGVDILVNRGVARTKDERAVSVGRRASARREAIVLLKGSCRVERGGMQCESSRPTRGETEKVLQRNPQGELNYIIREQVDVLSKKAPLPVKGNLFRATVCNQPSELWRSGPAVHSRGSPGYPRLILTSAASTASVWSVASTGSYMSYTTTTRPQHHICTHKSTFQFQ